LNNFDEVELVKGLLRCEPESCQILVNKYSARLFGYIRKRINSQQDAEEILNDIFYLIITKIDQYDPKRGKFESWIFSIVVNKVRDYLRKQQIQQKELTKEGVTSVVTVSNFDSLSREPASNELPTIRQTKKTQALELVLGQLSERDRAILVYHYNGLTNQEIADYLTLPGNTIRVYLSRAKNRLMRLLRT